MFSREEIQKHIDELVKQYEEVQKQFVTAQTTLHQIDGAVWAFKQLLAKPVEEVPAEE